MANIFQKINTASKNLKTYRVGLLQAKVYRKLVKETNDALRPYSIGSVDWAFLGILFDADEPITFSDMSELLEVKAPFVTEITNKLKERGWIVLGKHAKDSRIKLLSLTSKGRDIVSEIEKILRARSKEMLSDLSIRDVLTYVDVLDKIAKKKF